MILKPARASPEFHRRGFAQIVVIVLVVLLVTAGAAVVYFNLKNKSQFPSKPTATPQQQTNTPPATITASAKEDLVAKLGISQSSITVVSEQSLDWPDASLGCPKQGMIYAQVITPGYKIILSYQGKTYEYHSGLNQKPFLCEKSD